MPPARIACTARKKAKRGGEVSIMFSRFPRPHFRRRFVPKRTTRETASTARIGPLRDPGAKPCCTIAEPRAGVHIIKRQQRQHGPCHVTIVAAHLISILQPFALSIVPPPRKFDGSIRHHTRGVSVPEPSIMPGAVVVDGPENRRANPIRFVLLTATDQCDGGYRIVIEVGGAMQRPRFYGRIAGKE